MILDHTDQGACWVHHVAHYLRSHRLHVVDGVWPGDELPANCLEVAGRSFVIVPIEAEWGDTQAVQVGDPKKWASCFGAIAISMPSGEMRVCSRSRNGWHSVRTLDQRGMPQIAITIPIALWSPIKTLVEYLRAATKNQS